MTKYIHENTEFETNGDCSAFQINFDPDKWSEGYVDNLRKRMKANGLPVCDKKPWNTMSIVFSVLEFKQQEIKN